MAVFLGRMADALRHAACELLRDDKEPLLGIRLTAQSCLFDRSSSFRSFTQWLRRILGTTNMLQPKRIGRCMLRCDPKKLEGTRARRHGQPAQLRQVGGGKEGS